LDSPRRDSQRSIDSNKRNTSYETTPDREPFIANRFASTSSLSNIPIANPTSANRCQFSWRVTDFGPGLPCGRRAHGPRGSSKRSSEPCVRCPACRTDHDLDGPRRHLPRFAIDQLDIDCDDSSTRIGRVTSSATTFEGMARGRSTFDRPAREPPTPTNGPRQLGNVSACNGSATDSNTATAADQEPDDTLFAGHDRLAADASDGSRPTRTSPAGNLSNEFDRRSRQFDPPEKTRSTGP